MSLLGEVRTHIEEAINSLFDKNDRITIGREELVALLLGGDGTKTQSRSDSSTSRTKKTKTKKTKDPNAPKRPPSPYILWFNANRQTIINEHFGDVEMTGRDKVSKVGKKAGELWNAMSEDGKVDYVTESKKLQEEYKAAMAKYKPTECNTTTESSDVSNYVPPVAPDGWTGPLNGRKLHGIAGVRGKGEVSFDKAVKKANELGDVCSGITYHADTKRYTVRGQTERHKKKNPSIYTGDGIEGQHWSWVRPGISETNPKSTNKNNKNKATII